MTFWISTSGDKCELLHTGVQQVSNIYLLASFIVQCPFLEGSCGLVSVHRSNWYQYIRILSHCHCRDNFITIFITYPIISGKGRQQFDYLVILKTIVSPASPLSVQHQRWKLSDELRSTCWKWWNWPKWGKITGKIVVWCAANLWQAIQWRWSLRCQDQSNVITWLWFFLRR